MWCAGMLVGSFPPPAIALLFVICEAVRRWSLWPSFRNMFSKFIRGSAKLTLYVLAQWGRRWVEDK